MNADDPETFTIGYTLEAVAARTDHSLVFVAEARTTGRRVAIKVARDAHGADALRREIQVLRGLHHPHIVELIEAAATGNAWMVTPLASTTLEAAIASGASFAVDEVAGLIVAISSALSTVHRHRLVHGDVKPSNILLGDGGRPVLADFGSAHPTGTAPTQFTPSYFVDDGPEGDVASLAHGALAMLVDDDEPRANALRTVLREFARAGDRADVFVDAVTATIDEPRWPRLVCGHVPEETGDATSPYGPAPPPPGAPVPPRRPRRRRLVAVAAIATVAVVSIDHVREQHAPVPSSLVGEAPRR